MNLKIYGEFNQPIIFPKSLRILEFKNKYNQPIILPYIIDKFSIGGEVSLIRCPIL